MTPLFPNFLQDYEEYLACQAYWADLCKTLLRSTSQEEQWAPWLKDTFADGTPFFDGNPIYSLVNLRTRRGLRIIQTENESADSLLIAWLDYFGDDEEKIAELVISCCLCREILLPIRSLVAAWFSWREESAQFQDLLEKLAVL